jgi:molybdate transport system substrate-binding protein
MRAFTKTVMTRVCLALALIALVAQPARAQADDETLIVFAASSLTEAFEEIAAAFEAEHPGVDVVLNFGSSSTLAAQLAEGAPADVFASADTRQMDAAREAGRIAEPVRVFAHNRLTLAVPADNPARIESLIDLAKPGILLVVAAPEVPVRVYTDAMLARLAADPAYGDDYRAAVLANIVSEEDNVRQVVAKIALGEADAGIVYQSDITPDITESVTAIPIPDKYNSLAEYPIAVTDDTARPELAQAFVDFVLSDAGQAALAQWGFIPVDPITPGGDSDRPEVTETTPTPKPPCSCR